MPLLKIHTLCDVVEVKDPLELAAEEGKTGVQIVPRRIGTGDPSALELGLRAE